MSTMSGNVMGWILGVVLAIIIIVVIIGVSHSCRRMDQTSTDTEKSFHALSSVISVNMEIESTQIRNTAVHSPTIAAQTPSNLTRFSIQRKNENTGEAASSVTSAIMEKESVQTRDIKSSRVIPVVLVPSNLVPVQNDLFYVGEFGGKQLVLVNPELEYPVGDQTSLININNHHDPIITRINHSGSHDHGLLTARTPSIQGTMPVTKIFYHPYIAPSIKDVLRDVDSTIVTELEPDEEWIDGIGKII